MRRSRFSEEQIIGILKEHSAGMSAAELCRSLSDQKSHAISARTESRMPHFTSGAQSMAAWRCPTRSG